MKNKCQRCRLVKCFEVGMRKDRLLTPEKKRLKRQHIEESRRLLQKCPLQNENLTDTDRECLTYIQTSYQKAIQSIAPASTLYSLERSIHKTYSFNDFMESDQFFSFRFINFLRLIPEFQSLNPDDRVTLIKFNYSSIVTIRDALIYDCQRDLLFDDHTSIPISSFDEKYAHIYTSLFILFCGYDYYRLYTSDLRLFSRATNNNPLINQLLIVVLIFLESTAVNHKQTSFLLEPQRVFQAQSKYVDLFYRYLLEQYSSDSAPKKMLDILRAILNLQQHAYMFKEKLSQGTNRNDLHPIIQSIFDLN